MTRKIVLGLAAMALVLGRTGTADVVLMDEYWTGEILNNGVAVTEIDTLQTQDPTQAKTGEFSALLENFDGAPNVRFRGAARVTAAHVPPGQSEVSLWYRTDAWAGIWRLEIWMWSNPHNDLVKVLECVLDGGGEGGRLIADDEWHQAKALLLATEDYELAASQVVGQSSFVWLAPIDGWDVQHRTYIDRIEVKVVAGPLEGKHPAPDPPRHVRPEPGAQETGDGWIWWEAEDAASHDIPDGGGLRPDNADVQAKLSNGDWLQSHRIAGRTAAWDVEVAEDGTHALWCRAFWYSSPFLWRWDEGERRTYLPEDEPLDQMMLVEPWITAGWLMLGEVELAKGTHTLAVEFPAETVAAALDCWVLTKVPFKPDGLKRPGAEAAG